MGIAVTPEQQRLQESVRGWCERHAPAAVAREALAQDSWERGPTWKALADQGLLGLHLDEAHGGSGASLVDLAVVVEELGRALVPGPILPTLLAAKLIQSHAVEAVAKEILPLVAAGELAIAVAWGNGSLHASVVDDRVAVSGTHPALVGGPGADLALLPAVDDDGKVRWILVPVETLTLTSFEPLDGTRRLASVQADAVAVGDDHVLGTLGSDEVQDLAMLLLSAESAGVAGWCLDEAVAYAKVREQFGRPIGLFQAIKHRCADMLVEVELARASAWDLAMVADDDAERPLASAIAAAVALEAAVRCAKDCIQIHGGIGFTWEHDAHLYLRRATSNRQLAGRTDRWFSRVGAMALAGQSRELVLDVQGADDVRAEVRALLEHAATLEGADQRRHLADNGFLAPHWPVPWGRGAGPREQVVIAQEVKAAGVAIPPLVMADWVLPTLIAHGTDEQRERFMAPSLMGEITWCQMFSEPGAGSDLAALATKADRVDGGYVLNGQKVWTSIAQWSDWAICLARTNPDAPKHLGITYFLVDMKSKGIDIRPLRELTGHEMFNEVFLDDVFVPDDCVVGEIDAGWSHARTTLDSERVAIASGIAIGANIRAMLDLVRALDEVEATALLTEVGRHVARETNLSVFDARTTTRALAGLGAGPTSSVRKLVSAHHKQDVAEFGLTLLGPAGATMHEQGSFWGYQFLLLRSFTIFGGTSEIQRNVIGERILGLPRDAGGEP